MAKRVPLLQRRTRCALLWCDEGPTAKEICDAVGNDVPSGHILMAIAVLELRWMIRGNRSNPRRYFLEGYRSTPDTASARGYKIFQAAEEMGSDCGIERLGEFLHISPEILISDLEGLARGGWLVLDRGLDLTTIYPRGAYCAGKAQPKVRRCNVCQSNFSDESPFVRTCPNCKRKQTYSSGEDYAEIG